MAIDTQRMAGAPTSVDAAIDPDETINDLVARRPAVMPTLQAFGLDLCCGGGLTLREAAGHHRIALTTLLDALAEAPVQP